jgi:nucleoid-associated protein YgaU
MTTVTILPTTQPMTRAGATGRVIGGLDGSRRRPGAAPMAARCDHSFAPDLRGSRLTARGRAVVALLWLVLATAAAVPIMQGGGTSADRPMPTATVVVEPGRTLWELARSIDASADPRVLVDAIVDLNGLGSGADIHPGDVLVVPRR